MKILNEVEQYEIAKKEEEEEKRKLEEEMKQMEQENLEKEKEEEKVEEQKEQKKVQKSSSKTKKTKAEEIVTVDPTVKETVKLEAMQLFDSEWYGMEELFAQGCKKVFRTLREHRIILLEYLDRIKQEFIKFLLIKDDRQQHVSQFQQEFNEIDNEMRSNAEIKEEEHLRAEQLKEKLINICETRKKQAEDKIQEFKVDPFEKRPFLVDS